MATEARLQRQSSAVWRTRNGAILATAMASSAVAWWMIAWPVASLANIPDHAAHFAWTFAHMLGGSAMLFLGALNLYLAARRSHYAMHRRVGQSYLLIGIFGVLAAMAITLSPAHKAPGSPILTNASVSLLTLGLAWLAFAALGWRAARNRRFPSHAQWMVRSYVLVWSFVFCRIASRVSNIDDLGGGHAFIWLSWVGPLIVAELVMQWPEGSRKAGRKAGSVA